MIGWLFSWLVRLWRRLVERDLSRDSQWREEQLARVRRMSHEVQSLERDLERAIRRSR